MKKENFLVRKQQLVRNAISDAAVELFAAKGFDETTVEEVANAAGVSRRSFFRYFASKDDLLGNRLIDDSLAMREGIDACPAGTTPIEMVLKAVVWSLSRPETEPKLRQTVEIAVRSNSARHAYLSRQVEAEDEVADAFSKRLKYRSKDDSVPRLLASLTTVVRNAAVLSWFNGEQPTAAKGAAKVLANLKHLFLEHENPSQTPPENGKPRKAAGRPVTRRAKS